MPAKAPGHSNATAHLRFGEREGATKIPGQLQCGELTPELRSLLWAVTFASLKKSIKYPPVSGYAFFSRPWNALLKTRHVFILHKPIDEFSPECRYHVDPLKQLFFRGTYIEVFEFLEFVMGAKDCPYGFADKITGALRHARAAYIVVEKRVIFPTATEEEATALEGAFDELQGESFAGARSHLLNAGEELNRGEYANSVRESIHAVESISRAIVPGAKALAPALSALEERAHLHGALKKAFGALYGFTCEEQGVRHPLLDKNEAEVDRESAVFMLGACASFVSYLANKGRQAGLIK